MHAICVIRGQQMKALTSSDEVVMKVFNLIIQIVSNSKPEILQCLEILEFRTFKKFRHVFKVIRSNLMYLESIDPILRLEYHRYPIISYKHLYIFIT